MTVLDAVATYRPERRVPIESLGDRLGLTPMQLKVFRRYHQLSEVRLQPNGTVVDLLSAALTNLHALRGREHLVRYVLYARTFPTVTPFPINPLQEVCRRFGLDHANAFTVSHQACASGLLAIDMAGRLLAGDAAGDTGEDAAGLAGEDADDGALALILAGEKAFTLETQLVPETSIFGEGASACLVGRGPGDGTTRDRMLSYAASLHGEFDGERADVAGRYQREYHALLGKAVLAAVDRAGLRLSDIRLILPHNVNVVAWQRLCKRIGYPMSQVLLDNVPVVGHVFCADAFINYRTAYERGLLSPGDHYLVAAAGAARGATFAAMVFQH